MVELATYKNGWGRTIVRPKRVDNIQPARSDVFSMPYIKSDTIPPAVSPADGKTYTSLKALRKSYQADGNPSGIAFHEVPEFNPDTYKPPQPKTMTGHEAKELAEKAIAAVERGEPAHSFNVNE